MTLTLLLALTGCYSSLTHRESSDLPEPPFEAEAFVIPYIIEPPDILLIEAVSIVPRSPHRLKPLDAVGISVRGTFDQEPIEGIYRLDEEGRVNLGPVYGSVGIGGLTVEEGRQVIEINLKAVLVSPQVALQLVEVQGRQEIAGDHLVRPDGTIGLGIYGSVNVTGMTLDEAQTAIERYLAGYLLDPQIRIDVLAYNSKNCYVIFDGGGYGEQVVSIPITGNQTVLDVISAVGGLPQVASSKSSIWVARPARQDGTPPQILPIDWVAITRQGSKQTNSNSATRARNSRSCSISSALVF